MHVSTTTSLLYSVSSAAPTLLLLKHREQSWGVWAKCSHTEVKSLPLENHSSVAQRRKRGGTWRRRRKKSAGNRRQNRRKREQLYKREGSRNWGNTVNTWLCHWFHHMSGTKEDYSTAQNSWYGFILTYSRSSVHPVTCQIKTTSGWWVKMRETTTNRWNWGEILSQIQHSIG